MRTIGVDERRARLGRRHHLAAEARAADAVDVARSLVGLHSTDPATVFLAAAARVVEPDVAAIETALYEERNLVRMLAMRRTMWVVPVESLPLVDAACTRAIASRERRNLIKEITDIGVATDCEKWLATVEQATLDALAVRGAAFGTELSTDVPDLRTQYVYAEGKSYGGNQTLTTRILNGMSMAGRIVRGRPRGAWNSSQYRWAPTESWLAESAVAMEKDEAQAALVHAWLRGFGPGTVTDLKWWTGLTVGEVRKALATLDVVEVGLDDGGKGWVVADDVEPVAAPEPWVALLPALDPTSMGWTERDWYLGDYREALFDRSGNIGPTIWCDGRIVGGWAQRKIEGTVVVRLFEDIGAEMAGAVDAEAARLTRWIGDVRITPRFRTPLERELSA